MSRDILSDLYYGKITPWEASEAEDIQESRQRMKALSAEMEKQMDSSVLRLFEAYMSERGHMEALQCCDSFRMGFRLGVQLTASAFPKG